MAWYSPSAILTPGGVAAGLSDLGATLASIPERRAQIQRQMAQDQRAEREFALNEMKMNRDMNWQDQSRPLELSRMQTELAAAQEEAKRKAALAPYDIQRAQTEQEARQWDLNVAPIEAAGKGIMPLGPTALRQDVADAFSRYRTREDEDRARILQREDLNRADKNLEMVGKGLADPDMLPLTHRASGLAAMVRGAGERALKQRDTEADIGAKEGMASWYKDRGDIEQAKLTLKQREQRLAAAGKLYKELNDSRAAASLADMLAKTPKAQADVAERIKQLDAQLAEAGRVLRGEEATQPGGMTGGGAGAQSAPSPAMVDAMRKAAAGTGDAAVKAKAWMTKYGVQ